MWPALRARRQRQKLTPITPAKPIFQPFALTTPYVLVEIKDNQIVPASKTDWEAFFDRNFKKTEKQDQIKEYETLMKYGKNKYFWNEFIFEGYASYEKDMIMLAGFPDIPLSMPHSEASQKMRGEI